MKPKYSITIPSVVISDFEILAHIPNGTLFEGCMMSEVIVVRPYLKMAAGYVDLENFQSYVIDHQDTHKVWHCYWHGKLRVNTRVER